jgi:hypothetical protein
LGVEGSRKDASIRPYQAASICPYSGRVLQQTEGQKGAVQPRQGQAKLGCKFQQGTGLISGHIYSRQQAVLKAVQLQQGVLR